MSAEREYTIQEVVIWKIDATSTQDAIDKFLNEEEPNKNFAGVEHREIIAGPDGWEEDEYDAR